MEFTPDYTNIVDAAFNRISKRLPLYEHLISDRTMGIILNSDFSDLKNGGYGDKVEYFRNYCEFYRQMGYDSVSFECCIGGAMPNSGCLGAHKESVLHTYDDFKKYPWDEIPDRFFNIYDDYYKALGEAMPAGMKAVGGVGNGVFECVQDITGYTNLCYISVDDPEMYAGLYRKTGEVSLKIWQRFLERYGDIYCVLRFGDDLGFKSNSLISAEHIRRHVVPAYAKIIECVHGYGKPFLYHSCGCIFNVMEDMINTAKIDAKHSNEDLIGEFQVWVDLYGDRIANFGGIDTDALCRLSIPEIKEYIIDLLSRCGSKGIAFSTGNSIPDYVPIDKYLAMIQTVREFRIE